MKGHEGSHQRFTGLNPAFPEKWFYGLLRALPGDQACLTPSPALLIADLTPASGRQNDTTWPSASAPLVTCAARVHRIPPHVDDVRNAPLLGQDEDRYRSDLGQARRKILLQKGLDNHFGKNEVICPSGTLQRRCDRRQYADK